MEEVDAMEVVTAKRPMIGLLEIGDLGPPHQEMMIGRTDMNRLVTEVS